MKSKKTDSNTRSPKYRTERADVFSYHSSRNRSEESGKRQEPAAPTNWSSSFRHIPTILALIVIIASFVYASLLDSGSPSIVQISDSPSSILRSDMEYQEGVAEILSQSIWNRSKLTIDTDQVAQQIKNKFTEIGAVAVTIPLVGRSPVVQISPALPVLSVTSRSRSYAVNEDGRALLDLSRLSDEVKSGLIKVNDTLDIDFKQGDYVLPRDTVGFIKEVKSQLGQKDLRIESISLPAVANEVHVKIEGQPYIVKFNLQNDARQQVGSYLAVAESFSKSNQAAAKEYIDVRVDGRVYYK